MGLASYRSQGRATRETASGTGSSAIHPPAGCAGQGACARAIDWSGRVASVAAATRMLQSDEGAATMPLPETDCARHGHAMDAGLTSRGTAAIRRTPERSSALVLTTADLRIVCRACVGDGQSSRPVHGLALGGPAATDVSAGSPGDAARPAVAGSSGRAARRTAVVSASATPRRGIHAGTSGGATEEKGWPARNSSRQCRAQDRHMPSETTRSRPRHELIE